MAATNSENLAHASMEEPSEPHHCCGILPPHLLQGILDNSDQHHPDTVAAMRRTLDRTHAVRGNRIAREDNLRRHWEETGGHPNAQHGNAHGTPGFLGQSIIPPHMLEGIARAQENSPETRSAAQRTIVLSEHARSARQTIPGPVALQDLHGDNVHHESFTTTTSAGEGGGGEGLTGTEDSDTFTEDQATEDQELSMGAGYSGAGTTQQMTGSSTTGSSTTSTTTTDMARLYRVCCDVNYGNRLPGSLIWEEK